MTTTAASKVSPALPLAAEPHITEDDAFALPEQDLCMQCAYTPDHEPGVPQDIVDVSIEVHVQTIYGTGPEYLVRTLACGHSIDTPVSHFHRAHQEP